MAITVTTVIDQIMVDEFGVMLVRTSKRVFDDDGSLLGQRYHRDSFEPGQDVSTQPAVIKRAAQAFWTQAVIDAWNAKKAAALAARPVGV